MAEVHHFHVLVAEPRLYRRHRLDHFRVGVGALSLRGPVGEVRKEEQRDAWCAALYFGAVKNASNEEQNFTHVRVLCKSLTCCVPIALTA